MPSAVAAPGARSHRDPSAVADRRRPDLRRRRHDKKRRDRRRGKTHRRRGRTRRVHREEMTHRGRRCRLHSNGRTRRNNGPLRFSRRGRINERKCREAPRCLAKLRRPEVTTDRRVTTERRATTGRRADIRRPGTRLSNGRVRTATTTTAGPMSSGARCLCSRTTRSGRGPT